MDKFDYSSCLIDPENESDIEKLKSKHEEFLYEESPLTDNVIMYIVLTYDINSPLRELNPNFYERKNRAATLAGYKQNKERRFDEAVEKMMIGANSNINLMIVRYIIMHGSPDITAYVAFNEILHSELKKSLSADSYESKDLRQTRDNIKDATRELNSLHQKIFGGIEGKKLRDQLYKTLENDRLRIRPEHVATALATKTFSPDVDPYEIGDLVYDV